MLNAPPDLHRTRFAVLLNAPENHGHSNGIRVMLQATQDALQAGVAISVVPAHTSTPRYTRLPPPFAELPVDWEVPPGCCALVGDTITPGRLAETRARAARLCHYALAPVGLFGDRGPQGNFVRIEHGERQAVYSPQIAGGIPSFYLQTRFAELEPWLRAPATPGGAARRRSFPDNLRVCVYPGKGHLRPVAPELRRLIRRSRSTLITREYPPTKDALYRELAGCDLLISFDPLTSLSHESILLGRPVLIAGEWDEPDFGADFPVRLDGMVWNDVAEVLRVLREGYDHAAVLASYRAALARNGATLLALLAYACGEHPGQRTATELNAYWAARQPFFSRLRLAAPDAVRWPLSVALPPISAGEWLEDSALGTKRRAGRLLRRWRRRLTERLVGPATR
jgi:hypothetical protein